MLFIPNNKKIYSDFYQKEIQKNSVIKKNTWQRSQVGLGGNKPFLKWLDQLVILEVMKFKYMTIMHDFNLPYKFSEEMEKETEKLNDIISEKEIGKRKDLKRNIFYN